MCSSLSKGLLVVVVLQFSLHYKAASEERSVRWRWSAAVTEASFPSSVLFRGRSGGSLFLPREESCVPSSLFISQGCDPLWPSHHLEVGANLASSLHLTHHVDPERGWGRATTYSAVLEVTEAITMSSPLLTKLTKKNHRLRGKNCWYLFMRTISIQNYGKWAFFTAVWCSQNAFEVQYISSGEPPFWLNPSLISNKLCFNTIY